MRITKVPLRDRLGAPGVLGLLLVALLTLGSVFTAPAANAATTNVSITNAQLDKSSAGSGEKIRMSFNWAVPNGAQPGDTFTIVLPSEVRPASTAKFDLERSPGEVVAEGRWSGNTATFTLAEFVRGKQDIQGSAYFSLSWNRDNVNTVDGADYNLHFTGTSSWTLPLTLLPDGPAGTGQSNSKVGWWLSDDQGSVTPKGQLGWVVYLNSGTATPVDPTMTITDTPGAGSHIDLDSVEGYRDGQPLRKERYSVSRLGEHGISITLVGNYPGEPAIYNGENIYFRYASDLLPGENGIFTNSATITGNSDAPQQVSSEVRRDGAGGDGNGNQPPEEKAAPVAPTVAQAACTEAGSATVPTVTPADTTGITYSVGGDVTAGSTVTVTATANKGYALTAAEGWTISDDKRTATYTVELKDVACDQPVTPVAPTVTQAVCTEDGSATAPTVTVAETAGVTYSVAGDVKAGSTATITATAEEGSSLKPAEGWTVSEDKKTATFVVELKDVACDQPVAPVAPTVTQAVCTEDGSATAPTVTVAETAGVTYRIDGDVKAGSTATITATTEEGSFLKPAEGWTVSEDKKTATFVVELKDVACDQPVTPVAPTVTQALCTEDGSATAPNVTAAETAGITYTVAGDMKAGSTVTITATAEQGSFLKPAEGWTLATDGRTATIKIALDAPKCTTKTPTTTPPTNKPNAEQHTPPAANSPIAATGLASAPVFLGSAALLVLVGLMVVGARRKA
ncbi:hypothetical protein FB468_2386 [Leucobacter komagatae]|uniref:SDR-like Ig domain-containing protein n=1 Tax=Leucobacter komagatae TaxID=55969 RepID=A0A542Y8A9_9MICO|nr:hypothetical protein FB468_2386 [Leucobacter komagatae]